MIMVARKAGDVRSMCYVLCADSNDAELSPEDQGTPPPPKRIVEQKTEEIVQPQNRCVRAQQGFEKL